MPDYSPDEVRDDFVPKADYLDRAFHELEKENLWPKVWQIAAREDEIPNPGDFIVYDIIDDSILVVRGTDGAVRAFHNVCTHRGTLLAEGSGNAKQFVCPFHGWRFATDGRCVKVIDRQDWGDCLAKGDTDLAPVQAQCWLDHHRRVVQLVQDDRRDGTCLPGDQHPGGYQRRQPRQW